MKKFSIILPVYKNEKNLPVTIPYIMDRLSLFLNYEVDFFNYIVESYYKNKKLTVSFARRNQRHSILDCALVYIAMKIMEEQIIRGEKNEGLSAVPRGLAEELLKNRKKE